MPLQTNIKNLTSLAKGMNVLYIEDESSVRENIVIFLDSIFNQVVSASNGLEGLQQYKSMFFDIVITDVFMPQMNGIAMVKKIKELNPKQSVIITSACEESDYLLELINLGISHFLLKPLQTENMLKTFYEVVANIYNQRKVQEITNHLRKELLHQTTLLEQYKEVVDLSTIVAQTDIEGNIIYVNDAFCKTTGYSAEDIMYQNFNIIRHPDMSNEFYKNLWDTILQKKSWRGIIKNINKDGNYYIIDSTIKPIVDEFGDITNFISLSHDITELFDLNDEIWQTQHEMLLVLAEIGETRSQEMGNHVKRVAKYAKLLAELYGLTEEEIKLIYSASPMHDIGKIGIPDNILLKPGTLEPHEYELMKSHSEIGYAILRQSNRPLLEAAAIIAHQHHEKWDGTGYPNKLQEDDIHIYGRIVAIADVFDALACNRVYKSAWTLEETIQYIQQERGKHFDPRLVDVMLDNIDSFLEIAFKFKD